MGNFPFGSKTFWSGLAMILLGAGSAIEQIVHNDFNVQAQLAMIFTGLGLIGLRQAVMPAK